MRSFTPEWRGPCEAFAVNYAHAHYWRVQHLIDSPEDAVQECAVVFVRCAQRYADSVDNPRWFMALYKQAVKRSFSKLARASRRRAWTPELADMLQQRSGASELPPGPLAAALGGASSELRTVLQTMAGAPQELVELLLPERAGPVRLSRLWSRLAGTGRMREDLVAELHELLC